MNQPAFIRLVFAMHLLLFVGTQAAQAQFEGIISYRHRSPKDTLLCNFYVKEPMVKYEEVFTNGSIKRYIVADLSKGETVSVYPSQNIVEHKKISVEKEPGVYTVEKKQNKTVLNGMECVQWMVKNSVAKEMMLFYVHQDDYSFFTKFCSISAHFSDVLQYFATINNAANYMPMRMKKTDLLWKPIKEIQVISVDRQSISNSTFDVPKP